MKKYIFVFLTLISMNVFGQIKVKDNSFKKIDGYVMMDKYEHTDMNNAPMALIKISTENIDAEQRRKFTFKGNLATYFDVRFEPGEIYLYISASAATFLEIIHDDYGKTEYWLPETLCDYCGYEMVIQYVPLYPTQERVKPQNNFVSVVSDQDDASIYIDDEYIGEKEAFKSFPIGTTHTWRIECDLYHTENGTIEVTTGDNIIERKMRPAHGFIKVDTKPEDGAIVFINNKKVGVSPYTSDKLASGTYKVKVMKELFKPSEQSFIVNEGQTTNAILDMMPNFVNVTINTDSQSDIYVDDEFKAKGSWNGRLSVGPHSAEARKELHKSSYKEINLTLGKTETITIDTPTPICGFLEISSTPMKADIYIDGKLMGQTPNVMSDVLVGEHELRLEKEGCELLVKNITIVKDETLKLFETLKIGNEVVIKTDADGDKVYIDGNYVGLSPLEMQLSHGSHIVRIERGDNVIEKNISVLSDGGKDIIEISLYEPQKFVVNGVEFTMIAVEGGSFQMGSDYFESDRDERILHQVTLNDYYIGETEVTQELWQAVMNTNVQQQLYKSDHGTKLRGSGNDFPMYYVNWYEAKEFCNKLSEITGKTFRLPTEAEWEYAARGGRSGNNYKYSGSNILVEEAWYYDNSDNSAHIVKSKNPNELGIYDMSGNVWEWCEDWYGDYEVGYLTNPIGPSDGSYKVIRGGSWGYGDKHCRVHNRYSNTPSYRYDDYGFRIVYVP